LKNNLKFKKWFEPFEATFRDLVNKNRDLSGAKNPFPMSMTIRGSDAVYDSHGVYEIETLLRSALNIAPSIDESLIKQIFLHALFSDKLSKKFTLDEFSKLCRQRYSTSQRRTTKKFVVCSGLFIKQPSAIKRLSYEGHLITILKNDSPAAQKFQEARLETISKFENEFSDDAPLFLKIHIEARDGSGAIHQAFRTAEKIRGLMNLAENRHLPKTRVIAGKQIYRGLSKFRYSKYFTVHLPNGKIVPNSNFIYYPEWEKWNRIPHFDEDSRTYKQFEYYLSKSKAKHGLSEEFYKLLELYLEAIDEKNIRAAFLKLWTLVENLTAISGSDNHTKVVDRLLKFTTLERHNFAKMALTNIRLSRNNLVHQGKSEDFSTTQTLIYQLHDYVHFLMRMYLVNDMEFSDLQQFKLFMDLPRDQSILNDRQSLIEKAIQHRNNYP